MDKISDEIIMAYVDGELDKEQSDTVRKALKSDPHLQKKAALFQDTSSMLDGVYDAPLNEEVPERLLNTIKTYRIETPWEKISSFFRMLFPAPAIQHPLATALVAVLIIGAGLFSYLKSPLPTVTSDYPPLVRSEAFRNGMETIASGQIITIAEYKSQVIPLTTFQDKSQNFCRQFEVTTGSEDNQIFSQGIACRPLDGAWNTVAFNTPEHSSRQAAENSYELAGDARLVD
ncbi:MAG TPA: hypothetical protein EYP35_06060, partial [Desulfobacterales bacterium]|nr:hypothetical protein [Desulfobacterales bacterium]